MVGMGFGRMTISQIDQLKPIPIPAFPLKGKEQKRQTRAA